MERLNRIKQVLVDKDKKQVWLAEQLGRNVNTVSSWCSNRKQPSIPELKRIADMLEVDIRELLISTLQK